MFIEQISGQKIKIKFDINEKQLLLGDILKITASGKTGVLVQITGISTAEKNPNFNLAESKILYTIDSAGKLINWQGNIPSQDFLINKLSAKEVLLCSNTLNTQTPLPVGILSLYPDTEVNLEASFFERPTVIYCDKQTQKDNILSLLSCELSKTAGKTVLIDFDNSYSDLKVSLTLEAGKNIKLPFDLKGLELLYKKSLSEASAETRATVEDIFMEVENYLSSGEIENIPFSSFRQAVDSVYASNKLTELVLLKNKLFDYKLQNTMSRVSKRPLDERLLSKIYRLFYEVFSRNKNQDDFLLIIDDILSPTEKIMLSKRLAMIYLLIKKVDYRTISETLKVSTATVLFYSAVFKEKQTRIVNLIKQMLKKEKVLGFLEDVFADLMIHPGIYIGHHKLKWEHEKKKEERKTLPS